MIRVRHRLAGTVCCVGRAMGRVRARSPPQTTYGPIKSDDHCPGAIGDVMAELDSRPESVSFNVNVNRVMVVIDQSDDAWSALHWALSHAVGTQDTVLLLYVSDQGCSNSGKELGQRAYGLLCSMKNRCQMRRPGLKVEIAMKEGKEKGEVIVEEAKRERVSLLVMGMRKKSIMWRLRKLWQVKFLHKKKKKKKKKDEKKEKVVDYCIQNSNCMAIAVRRKSRRHGGGYLITTKCHKNFWLLA